MFYKHPLLKPNASCPMNSEVRCIHVRSSRSLTLRENLNLKHLPFNFLYLCPKNSCFV